MKILQLIHCLFGRHRRSARQAKWDGHSFRSVCSGCGVPMVRELHGWRKED